MQNILQRKWETERSKVLPSTIHGKSFVLRGKKQEIKGMRWKYQKTVQQKNMTMVVVVVWSACLPITLTIQVWIPLRPTIYSVLVVWKEKEVVVCPLQQKVLKQICCRSKVTEPFLTTLWGWDEDTFYFTSISDFRNSKNF